MTNKPKLLLIAGYFPPVRISSGSIRPWNLARCLIDLGWEVTVVTPKISIWDPKNLDNVENVKQDIERIGIKMIYTSHLLKCLAPWRYDLPKGKISWFFGGILRRLTRFLGIQNWVGWVPSALKACKDLKSDDVDIILATGAPFWGFEIAYRLSIRLKKPYVMDYRDLWTDNPWNPVDKKWVANQEKKLLQNSSAVTIVSPISGMVLGNKYDVNEKISTITNGYDINDVQIIEAKVLDHFSIIFAGMLIPPKLTLSPLYEVLNLLKQNKEIKRNWKFHYFGPNSVEVKKEVFNLGLQNESIIHGNISRKELLPYLKGASLNVVLSSNSHTPTMEDRGVIPGKVFELIGMKASILPIVPKGSAVESVMSDVGMKCFDHNEIDEITDFIIKCMNGYHTNIVNEEKYSWEELAKKFNQLFQKII